uniref:ORF3 n=1 Tax=Torque teno virus TaxID=68887 RepID=X4Y9B0_9VIRU|nr:ORF3 [Torque teno virus]
MMRSLIQALKGQNCLFPPQQTGPSLQEEAYSSGMEDSPPHQEAASRRRRRQKQKPKKKKPTKKRRRRDSSSSSCGSSNSNRSESWESCSNTSSGSDRGRRSTRASYNSWAPKPLPAIPGTSSSKGAYF